MNKERLDEIERMCTDRHADPYVKAGMADELLDAVRERDKEIERLKAAHDKECCELIAERDQREEKLDEIAEKIAAIRGIELGEHSNCNDPVENALEELAEIAVEMTELRGKDTSLRARCAALESVREAAEAIAERSFISFRSGDCAEACEFCNAIEWKGSITHRDDCEIERFRSALARARGK